MNRPTRRRRAFALLTVVALIAIIGMAVVALSALFATDITRTRSQVHDAQVRQLLAAGAAQAPSLIAAWDGTSGKPVTVNLPANLTADGGALSVQLKSLDDGIVEAEISATYEGRRGWQTLRYTRKSAGLALLSATLNP